MSHLSNSFAQLRQAQAKFRACIDNVGQVKPGNKGALLHRVLQSIVVLTTRIDITDKTILVPLTNSLYVPGKLSDHENVIVDVGTGYYVKKVRDS